MGKRIYSDEQKEANRARARKWQLEHPDAAAKRKHQWYVKNKEKLGEKSKAWAKSHPEERRRHRNTWKETHPGAMKMARAKYLKNNPLARMSAGLRRTISKAIKNQNACKSIKSVDLIGCSFAELKVFLESKFTVGMSWDNYGYRGWHIDHIIPCAAFDLTDLEQQKKCFHYTNLQPLWAVDNWKKGDRMMGGTNVYQ